MGCASDTTIAGAEAEAEAIALFLHNAMLIKTPLCSGHGSHNGCQSQGARTSRHCRAAASTGAHSGEILCITGIRAGDENLTQLKGFQSS